MANDSKIVLTAIVFFWTYINVALPGTGGGAPLYIISCIFAVFQFYKSALTKWCIMSLLLGLAADILFPVWAKP